MNVVIYVRISTKEQSNWSIEGQRDSNTDYAERSGWNVVREYIDDGKSGKDFERAGWIALEKYVRARFRSDPVYAVIVSKFNRFARNASEGLAVLERFEKQYSCRIISAMEHFQMNPHSAYFYKYTADLLVNADFERRVIREQCLAGRVRAAQAGRYTSRPPYGYLRGRDGDRRPIIIIDEQKAEHVRAIFLDYAAGLTITEVTRRARARGFLPRGKSRIRDLLLNRTYAGMVKVPAYQGNPSTTKKGVHEALIDLAVWKAVQTRLDAPKSQPSFKTIVHDDFPLRGFLCCAKCEAPLTAHHSTGRNKTYPYYRCLTCARMNHNADRVHTTVRRVLAQASIPVATLQQIDARARELVEQRLESSTERSKQIVRDLRDKQAMLLKAEEQMLKGVLSDAAYGRWVAKLSEEITELTLEKDLVSDNLASAWVRFEASIPKLAALDKLYDGATTTQRQLLARVVFPFGLYASSQVLRTAALAPILHRKQLSVKGFEIGEACPVTTENDASPLCGR